ncbi:carbonate dehydratase [Mucilaginibacter segetis]|uniref:Carbonic anhydrase 2 n=1 Tax=Mucilaginibacter segetis TaxID=2793071 RepID=A0A934PWG6_9SPHI|nr:carbonate dehydratase [Mucilaginibacter segetis]MBK0380792.1 carbonate dehydratase [Mucilaginibacter segetis]
MCAKYNKTIHDTSHINYQSLLAGNKQFVADALNEDPEFFNTLANGQKPPVLWIGCADSRVPANQITNTQPGEIFVHRNIANMVIHTDMNMLSVLDYAVNVLQVKHVIVVGHYGCGGVIASMSNQQFGLIDNWLRHIKDVYRLHAAELDAIDNEHGRVNRLVELNIMENVNNLCKTSIVQNAWEKGQELSVHGWVYDVGTGIINDLKVSTDNNSEMDDVFKFDSPGK